MKVLLHLILCLSSFSLFAQSNTDKKANSTNQTKGGCSISFYDLSMQTTLQTSPSPNVLLTWDNSNNHVPNNFNCFFILIQTLERQIGTNGYDTLIQFFGDTFYIDSTIVPGLSYNYRLSRYLATTLSTYVSFSDTISTQIVGIEEVKNTISKIYPIPTNDFLFFETEQHIIGEPFSIINISGQTVMSGTISSNKMNLNVQDLPTGFYFLRINKFAKKFLVGN